MIARIAAVQASPVYMDLERSLDKTISLIGEAASKQATVVVFPETFLQGYPAWLDCCRDVNRWDHEPIYNGLSGSRAALQSKPIKASCNLNSRIVG